MANKIVFIILLLAIASTSKAENNATEKPKTIDICKYWTEKYKKSKSTEEKKYRDKACKRKKQVTSYAIEKSTPEYKKGQIYKWTNKDGNITYSDKKPVGEWFKTIKEKELDRISTMDAPKQSIQKTKIVNKTVIIKKQPSNNNAKIKEQECNNYKNEIEQISDRLRRPYHISTGVTLKRRKRELSSIVFKKCR